MRDNGGPQADVKPRLSNRYRVSEGRITVGNAFKLMDRIADRSVDLVICDGPYGVTDHHWDRISNVQELNLELIKRFARLLKPGGSVYLFGKPNCLDFIDYRPYLTMQSRIVWYQPSRLAQGKRSYTNNYDIICYLTKGKPATFNLEDIRVPQLVELEHRKRCERVPSVRSGPFGKTVFNPLGKNPGDVWGDIKQLTYKSKELLSREYLNTIQKPERLIERLVLASSNEGDLVLDPFAGTGTVSVVCEAMRRRCIAFEINRTYARAAATRLKTVSSARPQRLEFSA